MEKKVMKINGAGKVAVRKKKKVGRTLLVLVVALHAPGFPAGLVVEAMSLCEILLALGALVVGVSRECAALVNVCQAQRLGLTIVEALAFAILEVVINDGPDAEVAVVAALGAVEAEVCDVDVAGDEEGVGAGNKGSGSGEDGEELHLD